MNIWNKYHNLNNDYNKENYNIKLDKFDKFTFYIFLEANIYL